MPTSRSTIVSLLFFGSPIAVFWGIRTVVISTFYTVFVTWTAAHIGKKIGVIVPAWIDRYASAAVVLILSAKDIAASTAKRAPRYPFWRLVSFSVFGFGLCNMFSASASARARSFGFKVRGQSNVGSSAFAEAQPTCMDSFHSSKGNNGQKTETQTCDIDWFGHERPRTRLLASSDGRALQRLTVALL